MSRLRIEAKAAAPRPHGKLPPDFDDADGFYAAALAYGQALDLVRAWHERRYELVGELRARGVPMLQIAGLLRCSHSTAYRLLREWERLIAEYDRRMIEGDDIVVM